MEEKDEYLWRIARKRAGFKKQLASYIIVNGFLWALWWLTDRSYNYDDGNIPWPAWSTLGWGIGIAFSYYGAYYDTKEKDTLREYEKLKNKGTDNE